MIYKNLNYKSSWAMIAFLCNFLIYPNIMLLYSLLKKYYYYTDTSHTVIIHHLYLCHIRLLLPLIGRSYILLASPVVMSVEFYALSSDHCLSAPPSLVAFAFLFVVWGILGVFMVYFMVWSILLGIFMGFYVYVSCWCCIIFNSYNILC